MSSFTHYMYVVECADGTLYTGYAVDVESRVAAHNAGKGAKYTRTRTPINLLAKARFYTKQRAMSAEAYFKHLTRNQKDALLARAAKEPFEQLLQEAIPAFGEEPVHEWVARMLCENQDVDYSQFMAKLMPSVDPKTVVGVRTPALRKIAKQLAKRSDLAMFYATTPHKLFEENQLHSFSIDSTKDYDLAVKQISAFLPHIDNWATCDQLPNKILKSRPQESLPLIYEWIASDHIYTARYGIQVLMQHYLDELFETHHLKLVANKRVPGDEKPQPASDAYYMSMMRAWYFAEAMAKQPETALPYLLHPEREGNGVLDEWTRKKAIQKSVESYRVTAELKALLKENRK